MINREISKCDCSQTSEPLASRRWLDFTAVFMYSFRLVLESFRTDRPRNASRNTGNIIRIKEFNHKLDLRLKCVLWFSFHDSQPSASPAQRAHSSNFPSQFVFAQRLDKLGLSWIDLFCNHTVGILEFVPNIPDQFSGQEWFDYASGAVGIVILVILSSGYRNSIPGLVSDRLVSLRKRRN